MSTGLDLFLAYKKNPSEASKLALASWLAENDSTVEGLKVIEAIESGRTAALEAEKHLATDMGNAQIERSAAAAPEDLPEEGSSKILNTLKSGAKGIGTAWTNYLAAIPTLANKVGLKNNIGSDWREFGLKSDQAEQEAYREAGIGGLGGTALETLTGMALDPATYIGGGLLSSPWRMAAFTGAQAALGQEGAQGEVDPFETALSTASGYGMGKTFGAMGKAMAPGGKLSGIPKGAEPFARGLAMAEYPVAEELITGPLREAHKEGDTDWKKYFTEQYPKELAEAQARGVGMAFAGELQHRGGAKAKDVAYKAKADPIISAAIDYGRQSGAGDFSKALEDATIFGYEKAIKDTGDKNVAQYVAQKIQEALTSEQKIMERVWSTQTASELAAERLKAKQIKLDEIRQSNTAKEQAAKLDAAAEGNFEDSELVKKASAKQQEAIRTETASSVLGGLTQLEAAGLAPQFYNFLESHPVFEASSPKAKAIHAVIKAGNGRSPSQIVAFEKEVGADGLWSQVMQEFLASQQAVGAQQAFASEQPPPASGGAPPPQAASEPPAGPPGAAEGVFNFDAPPPSERPPAPFTPEPLVKEPTFEKTKEGIAQGRMDLVNGMSKPDFERYLFQLASRVKKTNNPAAIQDYEMLRAVWKERFGSEAAHPLEKELGTSKTLDQRDYDPEFEDPSGFDYGEQYSLKSEAKSPEPVSKFVEPLEAEIDNLLDRMGKGREKIAELNQDFERVRQEEAALDGTDPRQQEILAAEKNLLAEKHEKYVKLYKELDAAQSERSAEIEKKYAKIAEAQKLTLTKEQLEQKEKELQTEPGKPNPKLFAVTAQLNALASKFGFGGDLEGFQNYVGHKVKQFEAAANEVSEKRVQTRTSTADSFHRKKLRDLVENTVGLPEFPDSKIPLVFRGKVGAELPAGSETVADSYRRIVYADDGAWFEVDKLSLDPQTLEKNSSVAFQPGFVHYSVEGHPNLVVKLATSRQLGKPYPPKTNYSHGEMRGDGSPARKEYGDFVPGKFYISALGDSPEVLPTYKKVVVNPETPPPGVHVAKSYFPKGEIRKGLSELFEYGASTFELIKRGLKSSTTQEAPLGKVGDVIKFANKDGTELSREFKITKVEKIYDFGAKTVKGSSPRKKATDTPASKEFVSNPSYNGEWFAEWIKSEGVAGDSQTVLRLQTSGKPLYRTFYQPVDPPAAEAAIGPGGELVPANPAEFFQRRLSDAKTPLTEAKFESALATETQDFVRKSLNKVGQFFRLFSSEDSAVQVVQDASTRMAETLRSYDDRWKTIVEKGSAAEEVTKGIQGLFDNYLKDVETYRQKRDRGDLDARPPELKVEDYLDVSENLQKIKDIEADLKSAEAQLTKQLDPKGRAFWEIKVEEFQRELNHERYVIEAKTQISPTLKLPELPDADRLRVAEIDRSHEDSKLAREHQKILSKMLERAKKLFERDPELREAMFPRSKPSAIPEIQPGEGGKKGSGTLRSAWERSLGKEQLDPVAEYSRDKRILELIYNYDPDLFYDQFGWFYENDKSPVKEFAAKAENDSIKAAQEKHAASGSEEGAADVGPIVDPIKIWLDHFYDTPKDYDIRVELIGNRIWKLNRDSSIQEKGFFLKTHASHLAYKKVNMLKDLAKSMIRQSQEVPIPIDKQFFLADSLMAPAEKAHFLANALGEKLGWDPDQILLSQRFLEAKANAHAAIFETTPDDFYNKYTIYAGDGSFPHLLVEEMFKNQAVREHYGLAAKLAEEFRKDYNNRKIKYEEKLGAKGLTEGEEPGALQGPSGRIKMTKLPEWLQAKLAESLGADGKDKFKKFLHGTELDKVKHIDSLFGIDIESIIGKAQRRLTETIEGETFIGTGANRVIRLQPGKATVRTFLHEMVHGFVEDLRTVTKGGVRTELQNRMLTKLEELVAVKPLEGWTEGKQEQLVSFFEKALKSGNKLDVGPDTKRLIDKLLSYYQSVKTEMDFPKGSGEELIKAFGLNEEARKWAEEVNSSQRATLDALNNSRAREMNPLDDKETSFKPSLIFELPKEFAEEFWSLKSEREDDARPESADRSRPQNPTGPARGDGFGQTSRGSGSRGSSSQGRSQSSANPASHAPQGAGAAGGPGQGSHGTGPGEVHRVPPPPSSAEIAAEAALYIDPTYSAAKGEALSEIAEFSSAPMGAAHTVLKPGRFFYQDLIDGLDNYSSDDFQLPSELKAMHKKTEDIARTIEGYSADAVNTFLHIAAGESKEMRKAISTLQDFVSDDQFTLGGITRFRAAVEKIYTPEQLKLTTNEKMLIDSWNTMQGTYGDISERLGTAIIDPNTGAVYDYKAGDGGKLSRIYTEEFYQMLEEQRQAQAKGHTAELFQTWIDALHEMNPEQSKAVLKGYFTDLTQSPLKPINGEFMRQIKMVPDYVNFDGQKLQMLESNPHELGRKFSSLHNARLAFNSVFGQEIGPLKQGKVAPKINTKPWGSVDNLISLASAGRRDAREHMEKIIRAQNNIPVDLSPVFGKVGSKSYRAWQAYRGTMSVLRALKLSLAQISNVHQTVGNTLSYLGGERYLQSLVLLRDPKYQQIELSRLGRVTVDIFNRTSDPTRPVESFRRMLTDAILRGSGFKGINEINERIAAIGGTLLMEDVAAGRITPYDTKALRALKFSPKEVDILVNRKTEHPEYQRLLEAIGSRASEVTEFATSKASEKSLAGNNRLWRAAFFADGYAQKKLGSTLYLMKMVRDDIKAHGLASADARISAGFFGANVAATAASGYLTLLTRNLIRGGSEQAQIFMKSEEDEGILETFKDAYSSAMFGGITDGLYKLAAEGGNPRTWESLVRVVEPISYFMQANDFIKGTGSFKDMGRGNVTSEKMVKLLRSNVPLLNTKWAVSLTASMGLGDPKNFKLDAAINGYWQWAKARDEDKEGGPASVQSNVSGNMPEDKMQFRKEMRKAYMAMKIGAPKEQIEELLRAAVGVETKKGKPFDVAASLRGKRFFHNSKWWEEKNDAGLTRKQRLEKVIGTEAYTELENFDKILNEWARRF